MTTTPALNTELELILLFRMPSGRLLVHLNSLDDNSIHSLVDAVTIYEIYSKTFISVNSIRNMVLVTSFLTKFSKIWLVIEKKNSKPIKFSKVIYFYFCQYSRYPGSYVFIVKVLTLPLFTDRDLLITSATDHQRFSNSGLQRKSKALTQAKTKSHKYLKREKKINGLLKLLQKCHLSKCWSWSNQ